MEPEDSSHSPHESMPVVPKPVLSVHTFIPYFTKIYFKLLHMWVTHFRQATCIMKLYTVMPAPADAGLNLDDKG